MAGFVGICGTTLNDSTVSVEQAVKATVYSDKTSTEKLYADNSFILNKSFFSFLKSAGLSAKKNNVHVWIDGEIYNEKALGVDTQNSLAEKVISLYSETRLEQWLAKVDGIFTMLIYDEANETLQIITDRYGLKPFYIYYKNGYLIFATEIKCFTHFKQFDLQIRKDVLGCFMKLEHFIGSVTWFDNVDVAAPSTIYSYVLQNNTLTKRRYWSWANINIRPRAINEAAEALAYLLDNANKQRNYGNYKVGVALSGGLDSRAILAAVHESMPETYTFGVEESADVSIARRVAAMAGVNHTRYEVHVDDWLTKRFSGVWKTDGMLNMYHMHYSHLMNVIPKLMDVNLSGFLGDAVIGGSYLEKKGKTFLDKRINDSIAQHYYGSYHTLCDTSDSFFDMDKIDPYLFYNRGRRMIGLGAEEANKTIPQRLPFMDIELMDFAYSLPDDMRVHSKVYNQALLMKYPEFYRNIPHATTGVPISNHPTVLHRIQKMYNRSVYMVKYKLGMRTSFTDVYNWIKEPAVAKRIHEMLDPKYALYSNFTTDDFQKLYLEPHLNRNQNYMKQIMGAITIEVWLQQILNKKYIDTNLY